MSREIPYWLVLVWLAVLAAPADARQCNYGFKLLGLGVPGCPKSSGCGAVDVNQAGQVAGTARTSVLDRHAFIWDPVNGIQDLQTLGGSTSVACCINEAGQVAGWAHTASGDQHAFFWDPGGGMLDLGTLGGPHSIAVAMNDLGQVVGYSDTGSAEHAFIWDAKNGMQDLGSLVCCQHSRAVGINSSGQVTGVSYNAPGDLNLHNTQPFVWDSTNGLQALSTFGDSAGGVNAINDVGQIAGWMEDFLMATPFVPCLYSANDPTGFPSFPNGFPSTDCGEVEWVRNDGQAVGWLIQPVFPDCDESFSLKDPNAWPGGIIPTDAISLAALKITADGQVLLALEGIATTFGYLAATPSSLAVELRELIPAEFEHVLSPGDINDHGEIVGGAPNAYIMWPCPPDVNKDGAVNVLDLIELLLAFGQPCDQPPQRCPADTNKDGAVDVLDLIELLLNFGGPGV